MTEKDATAETATTMLRAAFMMPIEAMKAACDIQKQMLETMERFVPGADGDRVQGSAEGAQPPATAASVSAPSGGWGPVTPQEPATGWGPMHR